MLDLAGTNSYDSPGGIRFDVSTGREILKNTNSPLLTGGIILFEMYASTRL